MYELEYAGNIVREAAILVGVLLPDRRSDEPSLDELEGLAETAGVAWRDA